MSIETFQTLIHQTLQTF